MFSWALSSVYPTCLIFTPPTELAYHAYYRVLMFFFKSAVHRQREHCFRQFGGLCHAPVRQAYILVSRLFRQRHRIVYHRRYSGFGQFVFQCVPAVAVGKPYRILMIYVRAVWRCGRRDDGSVESCQPGRVVLGGFAAFCGPFANMSQFGKQYGRLYCIQS